MPTIADVAPLAKTLGNVVASGTEIIDRLGAEHVRTGQPIVYTSADSVFQIAAHETVIPIDEQYRIVAEHSENFASVKDEDGEECEDLGVMTEWVRESLAKVMASREGEFKLRAVNFSAYGASLVHIGADGKPVAPLYNYLKAYPEALRRKFYATYGGEVVLSRLTASPALGLAEQRLMLTRGRLVAETA